MDEAEGPLSDEVILANASRPAKRLSCQNVYSDFCMKWPEYLELAVIAWDTFIPRPGDFA